MSHPGDHDEYYDAPSGIACFHGNDEDTCPDCEELQWEIAEGIRVDPNARMHASEDVAAAAE